MAVELEGGCRVSELREGAPDSHGTLRIWWRVGRDTGARAISLRILECAAGVSPCLRNTECDEVFYVLEGEGIVSLDGHSERIAPDTAFYVPPAAGWSLENRGATPVLLAAARCPDPGRVVAAAPSLTSAAGPRLEPWPFARLWERTAEVTGDRWYRVLIDERAGSRQVTQFVGSIPPGRAPDHFHEYEEVLVVLKGSGRMWAGRTHTAIAPGSCIFLPRTQLHCVENTGAEELRLLGVFYPAGSPAVRYDADEPASGRKAAP
jgi:mannose-6-phosphate isomerase-like protein (cupin superfamily)